MRFANENFTLKQTKSMIAIYVLLCVEILILLCLAPMPVRVKTRFSIERKLVLIGVQIFSLTAVKIKVEEENGAFRISKNGKTMKVDDMGRMRVSLPKILGFLSVNGIIKEVSCLGFIGGENASDSAMNCGVLSAFICALFPTAVSSFLYPDFKSERGDFEMTVNARISLFQAMRLA